MKEEAKKVLKKQLELIKVPKEDFEKIQKINKEFSEELRKSLKNKRIKAEVFLGGSLAKNTLVRKDIYDIDIFVRFDKSYKDKISSLLGKTLTKAKKIHGSRDYYQEIIDEIIVEVIPVLKIKKPEEAVNVTDLSYFHVNYILNRIKKNKKLADEIRLAKTFVHAQNAYGAESYIHGFSGYALELIISYYRTFLKFIEEISKLDIKKEKLIIDPSKLYKNKNQVLLELNKSKQISPIILIDPTYKERNALSSLSKETFYKFQNISRSFLKKPSSDFFIQKNISDDFKENKNTKILSIKTNKQPGDIAGTKSKKFFGFVVSKLQKEFEIKKSGFDYIEEENIANFYFVLDKKKTSLIKGPPITSTKNLARFKKAHSKVFIKKGFAYIKLEHNLTFDNWFKQFLKKEKKIIRDMGIKEVKIHKPS